MAYLVFIHGQPRGELDVTVAELDRAAAVAASYRLAKQLPQRGARNELLDYEDAGRLLHYRTPTEGGSSGSPIFNQEWRLIGLHHVGGDETPRLNGQSSTYQANEGIRFDRTGARFDDEYHAA